MNYKPFDLKAAKAGKPIICRDGTPAKFIAHVPEACYSVVALINGVIDSFQDYGASSRSVGAQKDLFMLPERKTVWVNIYPDIPVVRYCDTRTEADKYAACRTACVEVTYEEGQGL